MSDQRNSSEFLKAMSELQESYAKSMKEREQESEDFWQNLSQEDRMRAFYSVCKRLYQGEILEQRSYRGVLYDVFGFDLEAYALGMECGYLELHNSIWPDGKSETKET